MTVVVWDGKTLATDKAASDGSAQWQTEKAWLFGESVLSGAGPLQSILTMREWYRAGALHNNFPKYNYRHSSAILSSPVRKA